MLTLTNEQIFLLYSDNLGKSTRIIFKFNIFATKYDINRPFDSLPSSLREGNSIVAVQLTYFLTNYLNLLSGHVYETSMHS